MDLAKDKRRGSRQASPRRQYFPLVGLEEPAREWNGHSLYRGGVRDPFMRFIVAPNDRAHVLNMGFTVLDLLITVGVVAFMLLLGNVFGMALDNCADVLGW